LFNARNAAMAALAAGLALFPDDPTRLKLAALARFRGVKRRQELRVDLPGLKVIEDFGHHPTALAETLHSFRARFPGHVIHAAFEPRSNTSRTKVMQSAFMRALALADEVYLGSIARADQLKPEERFDVEALMQFLESQGVEGHTAETNEALLEKLLANSTTASDKPQLVVFFTNGSFGGIIDRYVEAVRR
jgi:UDP-N-acetylmuramate: L-alanyl-gamma-D-glutamyl-meso-diaminopimelate ligase